MRQFFMWFWRRCVNTMIKILIGSLSIGIEMTAVLVLINCLRFIQFWLFCSSRDTSSDFLELSENNIFQRNSHQKAPYKSKTYTLYVMCWPTIIWNNDNQQINYFGKIEPRCRVSVFYCLLSTNTVNSDQIIFFYFFI